MDITEQLSKAQADLAKLEAERERVIPPLEADLFRARREGVKGNALEAIEGRLEERENLARQVIAEAKQRVSDLQEELRILEADAIKQAKEALAGLKAQALASWRAAGGSQEAFEAAWPGMQTELLKERALADLKAKAGTPEGQAKLSPDRIAVARSII